MPFTVRGNTRKGGTTSHWSGGSENRLRQIWAGRGVEKKNLGLKEGARVGPWGCSMGTSNDYKGSKKMTSMHYQFDWFQGR